MQLILTSSNDVSENDVRAMIRLVGNVAGCPGGIAEKKRMLMDGLARLIDADDWLWALATELEPGKPPAYTSFVHGGLSERRFTQLMMALDHEDMALLGQPFAVELKKHKTHLTRIQSQLDPDGFFYQCAAREHWDAADLGEVLLSFRPLEGGTLSSIGLYRRKGREAFDSRQAKMAHIVLTEVPWLHMAGWPDDQGADVPKLSPRRRTVLNLVLEGMPRKEIASQLNISVHTVGGYVKDLFRHFDVHSQVELISRFRKGDGHDTP